MIHPWPRYTCVNLACTVYNLSSACSMVSYSTSININQSYLIQIPSAGVAHPKSHKQHRNYCSELAIKIWPGDWGKLELEVLFENMTTQYLCASMGESSGQSEFFYYTCSTTAHSSFSNQGFAHQKLFVMMLLRNFLSIFLHLALLNANLVLCNPIHAPDAFALQPSSGVWASVVASVSPWMVLVGERNAKEHMRTASS